MAAALIAFMVVRMHKKHNIGKKLVFIGSVTSDIGIALAQKYSKDGYSIAGTYRSKKLLHKLASLPNCYLYYCDFNDTKTIDQCVSQFAAKKLRWDTFISCAAMPQPLTSFFESDFEQWSQSVHVNAIEHLRFLHSVYPLRNANVTANVVFFAGPATNNAVKNFSAYAISKIMLIKMCELLDAENEDLNVFIVGPGWTRTKGHELILSDPDVSPEKYNETLNFLKSKAGTSMDDIYNCIRWLSAQGRKVAGGRNFSVVYDPWKGDLNSVLAAQLKSDTNMYKLRRYKNYLFSDRQAAKGDKYGKFITKTGI